MIHSRIFKWCGVAAALSLTPGLLFGASYVLPVDAIEASRTMDAAEFRIVYPGIALDGATMGDFGYYIRYHHENLYYFFGPINTLEEAQPALWKLQEVVTAAMIERPAISTSTMDIILFDRHGVRSLGDGMGGDTADGRGGQGEAGEMMVGRGEFETGDPDSEGQSDGGSRGEGQEGIQEIGVNPWGDQQGQGQVEGQQMGRQGTQQGQQQGRQGQQGQQTQRGQQGQQQGQPGQPGQPGQDQSDSQNQSQSQQRSQQAGQSGSPSSPSMPGGGSGAPPPINIWELLRRIFGG